MPRSTLYRLLPPAAVLVLGLAACGPESIRGHIIAVDGDHYVVHTDGGRDVSMHVDRKTRMNKVVEGDKVRAFVAEDGRAEFIQKLE
jgi:hypothetical protein